MVVLFKEKNSPYVALELTQLYPDHLQGYLIVPNPKLETKTFFFLLKIPFVASCNQSIENKNWDLIKEKYPDTRNFDDALAKARKLGPVIPVATKYKNFSTGLPFSA